MAAQPFHRNPDNGKQQHPPPAANGAGAETDPCTVAHAHVHTRSHGRKQRQPGGQPEQGGQGEGAPALNIDQKRFRNPVQPNGEIADTEGPAGTGGMPRPARAIKHPDKAGKGRNKQEEQGTGRQGRRAERAERKRDGEPPPPRQRRQPGRKPGQPRGEAIVRHRSRH